MKYATDTKEQNEGNARTLTSSMKGIASTSFRLATFSVDKKFLKKFYNS
jgi:hypothetical protein